MGLCVCFSQPLCEVSSILLFLTNQFLNFYTCGLATTVAGSIMFSGGLAVCPTIENMIAQDHRQGIFS